MCHSLLVMFQIKQPPHIILGKNSGQTFPFVDNSLIITSKGAKKRGWLDYLSIKDYQLFDKVEPNPSLETVKNIIDQFSNSEITNVIGIGGGSSLDVAKYVGFKLKKNKINFIRINIYPDGGISRIRAFGKVVK